MKPFKTALRYWIAIVSLIGFLGGWATLAHARKPIQNSANTSTSSNVLAVPTLAPLQPLSVNGNSGTTNNSSNNTIFNFQLSNQQPQAQSNFPVISTRGS